MLQKTTLFRSILFFCFFTSFSQERIGSFKNDLKENPSNIEGITPIVNSKNGDIVVFIADAKKVYAYKLNNQFEVIDKMVSEEKGRKYKTPLGYSIADENNYRIIFTNKNERKFLVVDFSFSNKNTKIKEFELKDSKEIIIQTVSLKNKFYLITAKSFDSARKSTPNTSFDDDILNFYTLDKDSNLINKQVDLSDHTFFNENDKRVKAKTLLSSISTVDENVSNSIEIVAKTTKQYLRDHKILFTFDDSKKFTQTLEIDLKDFSTRTDTIKKNMPSAKKSNSFINKDKIFMVAANKEKLLLQIFNFKSKKLLKEFTITKDDPISFKTGPIIFQNEGTLNNYRKQESSEKFLRKITVAKLGVSVLKVKNQYQLRIGSHLNRRFSGRGVPIGTFDTTSGFFNPTMVTYNSSKNAKSTRIDSFLDENLEHIENDFLENNFDKIDVFLNRKNVRSYEPFFIRKDDFLFKEDDNDYFEVFKHKSITILGSFDISTKMYHFYKF